MWIARDKDGSIRVFNRKPIRQKINFHDNLMDIYHYMLLPREEFPEVTWENSPIEIISLKQLNIKEK